MCACQIRGHTAAAWASLLWSPVRETICAAAPSHCQPPRQYRAASLVDDLGGDEAAHAEDDGRWEVEASRRPELEHERCEIDRRLELSAEEFERDYVNAQQPVLIRYGAPFVRPGSWSRHNLSIVYGDLQVLTGRLPYERKVRTEDHALTAETMGLAEYISTSLRPVDGEDDGGDPLYMFDRSDAALRMLHDVQIESLGFWNASRMEQVSFQWYLGPTRSGANDHYHGHAFNALVHGHKRWFLTPTPFASYSNKSAWDWYIEDYPALRDAHSISECQQRAGEVLYVPSGWGHAVLNTANSIGFSGEFKVHREQWLDLSGARAMGKGTPSAERMSGLQYERLKRAGDGYGAARHFVHAFAQGML